MSNDPDPKTSTTDVVVQLSRSRSAPTLPFELRDHILPNTWEVRVATLRRLLFRYYQPSFERGYLIIMIMLTFVVPIVTYDWTLPTLERTIPNNVDRQVWVARSIAFAAAIATWIVLSMPVVIWKCVGKARVARIAEEWTGLDALAAPSRGAPVWKASAPGLFNSVVLRATVPSTKKSHFDRESTLPPYIATSDDTSPPSYRDLNVVNLSRDLEGEIRYGELPIYNDDKSTIMQV